MGGWSHHPKRQETENTFDYWEKTRREFQNQDIRTLDQILTLTLELTRLLRETATLEKICFGAGESNPGSAKVTTFLLLDGVPWLISAKDALTILATDWSVEDCVSWLGAAGH